MKAWAVLDKDGNIVIAKASDGEETVEQGIIIEPLGPADMEAMR